MKKLALFLPFLLLLLSITSCEEERKVEVTKLVAKGGVEYGGIFNLTEVEYYKNFYPFSINDIISRRLSGQIFQGLVSLNQENLRVEPCIAHSWDVNDDATEYVFYLNKGIRFHDDPCFADSVGREVTAHDFKYCFEKSITPSRLNRLSLWLVEKIAGAEKFSSSIRKGQVPKSGVEGIEVIDDYTLKINLTHPTAGFENLLTHQACWVFPKEALEKYRDDIIYHPIGTGPFKMKYFDDKMVLLERNDSYWQVDEFGNKLPYLDGVKMTLVKEKRDEIIALKNKSVDLMWELPIEDIDVLLNDLGKAKSSKRKTPPKAQSVNGMTVQYYGFNNILPQFSDKRVRRAFNFAIDRNELSNKALNGDVDPAEYGYVPPMEKYPYKEIKGFTHNPELARKLMAEAGYPNGRGFPKVIIQLNEGVEAIDLVANSIKNMLKESINVTVEFQKNGRTEYSRIIESGKAEMWRYGWIADYPDPENFLQTFSSETIPEDVNDPSGLNIMRYNSPTFDSIYYAALSEPNEEKRMKLYMEADRVLIDEAPVLFLYYENYIRYIQPYVQNLPINAVEHRDFTRVYFSR